MQRESISGREAQKFVWNNLRGRESSPGATRQETQGMHQWGGGGLPKAVHHEGGLLWGVRASEERHFLHDSVAQDGAEMVWDEREWPLQHRQEHRRGEREGATFLPANYHRQTQDSRKGGFQRTCACIFLLRPYLLCSVSVKVCQSGRQVVIS